MEQDIHILLIDRAPRAASRLRKAVEKTGCASCRVLDLDGLGKERQLDKPYVGVVDPRLEEEGTLKAIHALKVLDPCMPILCANAEVWAPGGPVSSQFDGVYVMSPKLDELASRISAAANFRTECVFSADYPLLVGLSDAMRDIRQKIRQTAAKDIAVLITGESGTGKELIARSIHCHSERKTGPLVKINCGALPDDLLESEVFGFQKGAFTGAHKDKPGRFELAGKGTLFIDEIGNLSYSLQAKFLQVLEDKAFSRLGDTDEKTVDARVVAATNSDLWKKVQEGSFRKDLFYRLNVVHIHAPALRERPEDVPVLAGFFLNRYSVIMKKDPIAIPAKVVAFLQAYHWPGNVRELENIVRRAIVMRDWGFAFAELKQEAPAGGGLAQTGAGGDESMGASAEGGIEELLRQWDFSLKDATKAYVFEIEKQAILNALKETRWNRKKAARILKVSYRTLISRIEDMDLEA